MGSLGTLSGMHCLSRKILIKRLIRFIRKRIYRRNRLYLLHEQVVSTKRFLVKAEMTVALKYILEIDNND